MRFSAGSTAVFIRWSSTSVVNGCDIRIPEGIRIRIRLFGHYGISQRPHRVRTWSPRGETPILQYNFNWDTISAAAGITFSNFYFRLYEGSVKSAQVVDFM